MSRPSTLVHFVDLDDVARVIRADDIEEISLGTAAGSAIRFVLLGGRTYATEPKGSATILSIARRIATALAVGAPLVNLEP